ncbi:hypothetical protein CcCBS67573_g10395 [Chytriomyces confervae]|uniref:Uncharacterized protein n=1 Tax=Chytriomyces confervae TaxID=246404 RepID=A0A507D0Q5_9FUNG|nr:hypothetical protein CcCBS67573_g10395 [Chytriomyces confervae]
MCLIADVQGNSDDVVGTLTGVDISQARISTCKCVLRKYKMRQFWLFEAVENPAKKPIQTKVKPFHATKLIIGNTKARNQKAARSSNRWHTYNSESLTLFGVSAQEMSATRQEEEMVLQAMFGPDFDSTTEPDAWHRLASRYVLAICAALHEKAKLWTGQPMVYSLVSWLQGSELEEFLSCPPPAYLKLAQEEQRAVSRQTSAVPSKTQQKKALTGGPLPRYNQLYYGVGVAITLKADGGTGRQTASTISTASISSIPSAIFPSINLTR